MTKKYATSAAAFLILILALNLAFWGGVIALIVWGVKQLV